jgi:hypothetical protein
MALPHFRNLVSTNTQWEPIYSNLFEIVVTLPSIIETTSAQQILLENATKIDGLEKLTPMLDQGEQRFKYSQRGYLRTPKQTDVDFGITFNINQNQNKSVETWTHLKRWYDLIWNSQTGELHYKRDYIGGVTLHIHDRTGEVVRRIDYVNTWIKGISELNFEWGNTDIIKEVNASFIADYWIDTYFDLT